MSRESILVKYYFIWPDHANRTCFPEGFESRQSFEVLHSVEPQVEDMPVSGQKSECRIVVLADSQGYAYIGVAKTKPVTVGK